MLKIFRCEVQNAVSSANILVLVLGVSAKGKSLQYTEYRMGESTEPCGTPAWMFTGSEKVFCILILQDRFCRNESMRVMNWGLLEV